MKIMNLVLFLILFSVLSNSFAEEIPCAYSVSEGSDKCKPGTRSNLIYTYENAPYVLSGRFFWQEQLDSEKLLARERLKVRFLIEEVYKGKEGIKNSEIDVLVSNAVLNFPGTSKSRGSVAKELFKSSNEIKKALSIYMDSLENSTLEKTSIYKSTKDFKQKVDMFSLTSNIYFDGFDESEDRELIIFPEKKYIVFLQGMGEGYVLPSYKGGLNLYEYSEELISEVLSKD